MDSPINHTWPKIVERSDFALLTSKITLLKSIFQIIQLDEKSSNTLEFSESKIHICNKETYIIQQVDVNPHKMGTYQPPKEPCAVTFQCMAILKFLKQYNSDPVICLSKPSGKNELEVCIFHKNEFATRMGVPLESEDDVDYVDDAGWSKEPRLHIDIPNFCNSMKHCSHYSSTEINAYPRYISFNSVDRLNSTRSMANVYGQEPTKVDVQNMTRAEQWEKLISRRLNQEPDSSKYLESKTVLVVNEPIVSLKVGSKIISLLSRMKPLSKNDSQMLRCYYEPDMPELLIKDSGVTVGTYQVYVMGTETSSEQLT